MDSKNTTSTYDVPATRQDLTRTRWHPEPGWQWATASSTTVVAGAPGTVGLTYFTGHRWMPLYAMHAAPHDVTPRSWLEARPRRTPVLGVLEENYPEVLRRALCHANKQLQHDCWGAAAEHYFERSLLMFAAVSTHTCCCLSTINPALTRMCQDSTHATTEIPVPTQQQLSCCRYHVVRRLEQHKECHAPSRHCFPRYVPQGASEVALRSHTFCLGYQAEGVGVPSNNLDSGRQLSPPDLLLTLDVLVLLQGGPQGSRGDERQGSDPDCALHEARVEADDPVNTAHGPHDMKGSQATEVQADVGRRSLQQL
jgi:hypothetical protein